jgi:hypothetical protein
MSHEVTTLSGQLVDVRHIATVHGGGSSSHVSAWTAERYEIWIRPDNGVEAQITIWSSLFPARLGHHVTLLLEDGVVLGLINWSTRKRANYRRTGRFAALGPGDLALIIVFLCTATLFSGGDGFPGFALFALLYALTAQSLRARRTDARLDELIEQWSWRLGGRGQR